LSYDNPFWFANDELLTDLLRVEVHFVAQHFANYPDLSEFFDIPEATIEQRTACFTVLAHCALMSELYETFAGRQEQSPSLGEEEKDVLRRTGTLFDSDAPAWVLELNEVAQRLPARIYNALPEPLRRGGGFYDGDPAQAELIHSTAKELSSVQKIQALSEMVFDQQLQRLQGRWSLARPATNVVREIIVQERQSKKGKARRTRDKLRMLRDKEIAEIDDVAPTSIEFVKLMDERKVQPQPTWSGWPGSWLQAYKDPRLRKLIHQDKSRALARVRRERKR
jgi:hypothetical protein